MNERLKELFIQKFGKRNFPKDNAEVLMSAEDLEKFAELIIKDIIDTTLLKARWYQEMEKDDSAAFALCKLVESIREDFGVE